VHERPDLAVCGPGGDDGLPALVVAPAAGAVVREFASLDAVSELAAEVLQRGDHVLVAVASDRFRRRGQRHGLGARERVGLRDVSKTNTVLNEGVRYSV
jgi:hypothetical protein